MACSLELPPKIKGKVKKPPAAPSPQYFNPTPTTAPSSQQINVPSNSKQISIDINREFVVEQSAVGNVSQTQNNFPAEFLIESIERIKHIFPELMFFHMPSLLYSTGSISSAFANSVVALCIQFSPEVCNSTNISINLDELVHTAKMKLISPLQLCSNPNLDNVQSLLMMSIYDWGRKDLFSSWMLHGMAVRMIQGIGIDSARKTGIGNSLDQEIERRTLWSCFIVEKMISFGRNRTPILTASSLNSILLPCSEEQFSYLSSSEDSQNQDTVRSISLSDFEDILFDKSFIFGNEDYTCIYLIKLFEIWTNLSHWYLMGGRRADLLPPWSSKSLLFGQRQELDLFVSQVPAKWKWSMRNYQIHKIYKTEMKLLLLNVVTDLCFMYLSREYTPFLPYNIDKPSGPSEPPFLERPPTDDYWENNMSELFKKGRNIAEAIQVVFEHNSEESRSASPFLSFTIFSATTVLVYGGIFTWMDPWLEGEKSIDEENYNIRLANSMILYLNVSKLPLVENWIGALQQMSELYQLVAADPDRAKRLHLGRDMFIHIEDSIQIANTDNAHTPSITQIFQRDSNEPDADQREMQLQPQTRPNVVDTFSDFWMGDDISREFLSSILDNFNS